VALLVHRDVAHAVAEAGEEVELLEPVVEHVLARLGQAGLDHHVVERHAAGEQVAVVRRGLQLLGHVLEVGERLAVAPGQVRRRRLQRAADGPVADADDLLEEALEEDRVAGLVDLLRGEELLLLLERRGLDVRAERVGDGVLAVEEEGEDPQRAAALLGRHALVPVDAVLEKSISVARQLPRSQRV
jgi:hypothetical protein